MDRHKEGETVDDNGQDIDWLENINVVAQYTGNRHEVLNWIAKFHEMWDGHLKRIDMAKHGIELPLVNSGPLSSAVYWAGPKAGKFQKAEIDERSREKAIEPAKSEQASLILFPQNEGWFATIRFRQQKSKRCVRQRRLLRPLTAFALPMILENPAF